MCSEDKFLQVSFLRRWIDCCDDFLHGGQAWIGSFEARDRCAVAENTATERRGFFTALFEMFINVLNELFVRWYFHFILFPCWE